MDVPIPLTRRASGYSNKTSDHVLPVKLSEVPTEDALPDTLEPYKLDARRLKRQDVIGRSKCILRTCDMKIAVSIKKRDIIVSVMLCLTIFEYWKGQCILLYIHVLSAIPSFLYNFPFYL